jgi:hypothetical protein
LGDAGSCTMIPRRTGRIDEIRAPFGFDMRLPTVSVIRMRMAVPAKPDVDGAWMGCQVLLERLCVRLAVDKVEIRGALGSSRRKVPVVATHPIAACIFSHPFPLAGGNCGVLQHIMVGGDDDGICMAFNQLCPPLKGLTGNHHSRISPEIAATDGLRGLIDITHHQEQDVADTKGVSFPGPMSRVAWCDPPLKIPSAPPSDRSISATTRLMVHEDHCGHGSRRRYRPPLGDACPTCQTAGQPPPLQHRRERTDLLTYPQRRRRYPNGTAALLVPHRVKRCGGLQPCFHGRVSSRSPRDHHQRPRV